jgi:hypothetical protein
MAHKPNFTAQLTNKEAVRQVAASVGCIHTRGAEKGKGSIREMLEEIGGGDAIVMFHLYEYADDIKKDVRELRKLAKQYVGEKMENTLLALANALEKVQDVYDD